MALKFLSWPIGFEVMDQNSKSTVLINNSRTTRVLGQFIFKCIIMLFFKKVLICLR